MLHNEARELLVSAYEKTHDAQEVADMFSVSQYTVYRLAAQKRKTGSVALRTSQRGRKRVLSQTDLDHIRDCIDTKPDITIEEIRECLYLSASRATVGRAIQSLGYTYKKKSLHASERERVRCPGKTSQVETAHQG